MAKKIVVTSGKGGVGKTTVVYNLGNCLSRCGLSVLMVDVDFGLNNLDIVSGVEQRIVYDIFDVLDGRCRAKQAIVQCKNKNNLYVLSSGNKQLFTKISGQDIKLVIESLSTLFDYILIDCPAGIDVGFHRAVACADQAIVVATPNVPSLRDADKVISILYSYKLEYIGLVVNRVRGDLILGNKMMSPKDIKELLKCEILGVVPEEDEVFLSVGCELPSRSQASKAYKIMAVNLHEKKGKIFNVTNKYSGFLGSVRRRIKKSI